MEDRHQAVYIPFRCSKETERAIEKLAQTRGQPRSEVLRDLVDSGLVAAGAKMDDDYLYELMKKAVLATMKPQVERLATISAKAAQISGAAFFMNVFTATRNCPLTEQQEIEEAAGSARGLGIQYLKLKDHDIDAFIREGVKQVDHLE